MAVRNVYWFHYSYVKFFSCLVMALTYLFTTFEIQQERMNFVETDEGPQNSEVSKFKSSKNGYNFVFSVLAATYLLVSKNHHPIQVGTYQDKHLPKSRLGNPHLLLHCHRCQSQIGQTTRDGYVPELFVHVSFPSRSISDWRCNRRSVQL